MKLIRIVSFLLVLAPAGFSQLTQDQRVSDFLQLAGIYAKNYAPYEWKRDVMGFDLYNVQPWLAQVKSSQTDIDFYDICVRYVASLQDSHDEFTLPSDFLAYLHFDVDIYDGNVLIEAIDRSYLPAATYPFQIGDQLVSVDGTAVADLIQQLLPYAVNGSANPTSRKRLAADAITFREQDFFPKAYQIGATATVVVQQQAGGTQTYTIPWDTIGTPFKQEGPVPGIVASGIGKAPRMAERIKRARRRDPAPPVTPDFVPVYMRPMIALRNYRGAARTQEFAGFGNKSPIFALPAGFTRRLGARSTDQFYSGTFKTGTHTIGLLRIPGFDVTSTTTAVSQFATEIAYFQQNTDGLVIDLMRNGGGDPCYSQSLAQYLIPNQFSGPASELRATQYWVEQFSGNLFLAEEFGADQGTIGLYQSYLSQVQAAMAQSRGRTGALPLCGANVQVGPATDRNGNSLAYTKPILVLIDEFTLSAAEHFAAMLKDAQRVTTFGMRTDGGGGSPVDFDATTYSEGQTRVTETMIVRAAPVQTPGFPATAYLENVGVYPDIAQDYMTADNLVNRGATFVQAFTSAIEGMLP